MKAVNCCTTLTSIVNTANSYPLFQLGVTKGKGDILSRDWYIINLRVARGFEKNVYHSNALERVENYLISTQFVHRELGEPHRCSLLKTNKRINKWLDNPHHHHKIFLWEYSIYIILAESNKYIFLRSLLIWSLTNELFSELFFKWKDSVPAQESEKAHNSSWEHFVSKPWNSYILAIFDKSLTNQTG